MFYLMVVATLATYESYGQNTLMYCCRPKRI
jgi:hypothetical protein